MKVRDFPPVEETIDFEADELRPAWAPSASFLTKHDQCSRAAYLHRLLGGGPSSHAMNRGTAVHIVFERIVRHLMGQDPPQRECPPELGQDILLEVFRDHPELVMPAYERDSCRYMVDHWCRGMLIDPETVIGAELPVELEVGKWTIRMRIDLAELVSPWQIHVSDYKTMFKPSREDFNERYFFTLQLYSLGLAFGTVPDFPGISLGENVEIFRQKILFPRTLWHEGLAYEERDVTRVELSNFRLDLEAQLDRLDEELKTQRWEPVPGTHCSECPAESRCPIPRDLRPYSQIAIDAPREDLERLARWIVVTGNQVRNATKRLKAAANARGGEPVRAGKDLAFTFKTEISEEIKDKPALRASVEAAARYGREFDFNNHVRVKRSDTFKKRRVPPGALDHEKEE